MRESTRYWRDRYSAGGTSGEGSYGKLAEFKARVINEFIVDKGIKSVLDLGCGDGNQIGLFKGFKSYVGADVSKVVLRWCRAKFLGVGTMQFIKMSELDDSTLFDLVISLDVVYHLLEQEAFEEYMSKLFRHANKYVIIYSSDADVQLPKQGAHIRQRKFTNWVRDNEPEWELIEQIENEYPYDPKNGSGSIANFYIYGRK